MAIVEQNVLLSQKDASGNRNLLYPVTKLECVDGAENLAEKSEIPSVDESLSETSTNPVQNKVVKAALDGKAPSSDGVSANSLKGFKNTTNQGVAPDNFKTNGIGYVTGTTGVIGANDAAMYAQAYSQTWVAQILQDYRNGQLAVRGMNNGTWQAWRHILDSVNYGSYIPIATASKAGLMATEDKEKLDGIAAGANAYTHPTHTAKSAGLYKVTVDAQGHVTSATAVAKSDITALGIPSTNTTYSAATTSAAGLMSAADKTKLDSLTPHEEPTAITNAQIDELF